MVKLIVKGREVLIDDEDYERVMYYTWRINNGYVITNTKIKDNQEKLRFNLKLHRLVLNLKKGDGLIVDHINGNRLDNRKKNLRLVNHIQNARNRKVQKDNASGYKGVFRSGKKYRARISVNNKLYNLGTYSTKEEAAKKYNEAALKYFGEYAKLNVIKGEK